MSDEIYLMLAIFKFTNSHTQKSHEESTIHKMKIEETI